MPVILAPMRPTKNCHNIEAKIGDTVSSRTAKTTE